MRALKTGTNRRVIVQARDRNLFNALSDLRMADRLQVMRLAPFGSASRANIRLLSLIKEGYLERIFIGTRDNGRKAVYSLSAQGATVVGKPGRASIGRPQRVFKELFAEHQIFVTETALAIKAVPPPYSVGKIVCPERAVSGDIPLIPDAYAEVRGPKGVIALYIEVDMGTENAKLWRVKAERYRQLAVSGAFEQLTGHQRFHVLVLATTDSRVESLRRVVSGVTSKLFWFASFEIIKSGHFWSRAWFRPSGEEKVPLL
jgi:protein involved in plasmid replication-relaxation